MDIAGEIVIPTRSDFSRIAVINLILRNARSHLCDECPLTSKSVRLSAAAAAIAAKCQSRPHATTAGSILLCCSSILVDKRPKYCWNNPRMQWCCGETAGLARPLSDLKAPTSCTIKPRHHNTAGRQTASRVTSWVTEGNVRW